MQKDILSVEELLMLDSAAKHVQGHVWSKEPHFREAILSLSRMQLVTDPHDMGGNYFSQITDKGRQVLKEYEA